MMAGCSIETPERDSLLQARPAAVRRIYLMRHGEVSYFDDDGKPLGSSEAPLTERGRAQAEEVRKALAGVAFDKAVVSGLPRTVQTGRIVLGDRKLPLQVREEFQEIRRGNPDLIPDAELERSFRDAFRMGGEQTPFLGGETRGALLDRVLPGIEALRGDRSWDTLLLVLHGAVNRALISYALSGGRSFYGNFEQSPACVNILELNPALEGEWVVRATNLKFYDPAHLESRATSMEGMLERYLPARRRAPLGGREDGGKGEGEQAEERTWQF